jgi:hypothetical protein
MFLSFTINFSPTKYIKRGVNRRRTLTKPFVALGKIGVPLGSAGIRAIATTGFVQLINVIYRFTT